MAIRGVRDPAEEIDCLATFKEGDPVRGFLRLPSTGVAGRLRLVDLPPVAFADEPLAGVTLQTLDPTDALLGCLPSCFVRSEQISMPVPAPFPLELTVNSAILGSEHPEERFESVSVLCHRANEFLDLGSATLDEVAAEVALRIPRAEAPFGDLQLQIFEIVERAAVPDAPELITSWSTEILLSGPQRTVEEWADPGLQALALLSFCLDRPLGPDLIYSASTSSRVEFHARWRETNAPEGASAILPLSVAGDRLASVAEAWSRLGCEAGELMTNVIDYQLRRGSKTPWDAFVVVARCIELYYAYSDRFESVHRPSEEHAALVERVLNSLPADLRPVEGEWIEASLRNSNRTGILDQVRLLLDSFEAGVLSACRVPADREEFAKTIRDNRNYYTHHPSHRPPRTLDGRELVVLQHRLWFLTRACLLREMGYSDAEIAALLVDGGARSYILS
jgi:ApeA N-terminal domain 1